jgi:phage shock protein A
LRRREIAAAIRFNIEFIQERSTVMALLERVSTLLRANVNDLIDKAEDPAKMLKQLLLDMENQLLQVKTQVAITIADQHLLEKKKKEHDDAADAWHRKAELAVSKGEDDLARAALDRSLSHHQLSIGFGQQIEDQRSEAELMKSNFDKLQQKLKETEARCELLIMQNRRGRAIANAHKTSAASANKAARSMQRVRATVLAAEAANAASQALLEMDSADSLDDRFRRLERGEQIEALLDDLKAGRTGMLKGPQKETLALPKE